jgi:hypothetical protein
MDLRKHRYWFVLAMAIVSAGSIDVASRSTHHGVSATVDSRCGSCLASTRLLLLGLVFLSSQMARPIAPASHDGVPGSRASDPRR